MIRFNHRVGREDGDVGVVVSNKLRGVNPPTADTLFRIVKLEVVPGIELNGEDLSDGGSTVQEAAGTSGATATVIGASDGTESANITGLAPVAIIVSITSVCLVTRDCDTAMTVPVVALLGGEDLSVTETGASTTETGVGGLVDDKGKAITTTTETRWVQDGVAANGETRHAELEAGLKAIIKVNLGGVESRAERLVHVRSQTHDGLRVIIGDHVGVLVLHDAEPLTLVGALVGLGIRAEEVRPVKLSEDVKVVLRSTRLLWIPVVTTDTNVPVVTVAWWVI